MKHCPYGGASHKEFYVRLSPVIVQCLHASCQKTFESRCSDKELESWKRPTVNKDDKDDEDVIFIRNALLGEGPTGPENPDNLMAQQGRERFDFQDGRILYGANQWNTIITTTNTTAPPDMNYGETPTAA